MVMNLPSSIPAPPPRVPPVCAVPLIEMRVPADTNFTMQKIVPSPDQSADHASGKHASSGMRAALIFYT
jgi:hypothetical protein